MGFRSIEDALALFGGGTSTSSEPASQHVEALSRDIAALIVKNLPHTAPDPYHAENLPPGVSKRAFQDAVRRGDVVAARIKGREFVEVADWNEYRKNRRRRKEPRKAMTREPHQLGHEGPVVNDADLFAAVGARRTK